MQISIDENNYVTGYAIVGGIVGGIEVDELPDMKRFTEAYGAYCYQKGKLELDAERYEQIEAEKRKPVDPLADSITDLQLAVAELYELILNGGE